MLKAIIYSDQTEYESLGERVNDYLNINLDWYTSTQYIDWNTPKALINVVTDERAFKLKENYYGTILECLTQQEKDNIVEIPRTNEDWFPLNE